MDTMKMAAVRPRRRAVPLTLVVIAANFALLGLMVVLPRIRDLFLLDGSLVWRGQAWRVFTYAWVHAGLWHCVGNMAAFAPFAAYVESRWGRGRLALAYTGACIGSGLFLAALHLVIAQRVQGASGAVAALMMLWLMGVLNREGKAWYVMLPEIALGSLVAFYFIGRMVLGDIFHLFVNDGVSHWGHLGGFLTGFVLFRLGVLPRDRGALAAPRVSNDTQNWSLNDD